MKLDEKSTIEAATIILEQYKTLKAIAGEKYVSKNEIKARSKCKTGSKRC